MKDYKTALQKFVDLLTERTNIYYDKHLWNLSMPTYRINTDGDCRYGFDRIVTVDFNSVTAFCFIHIETGDIYRPNGYDTPGNKIVNNIYKDDPLSNTAYGDSLIHLSETV